MQLRATISACLILLSISPLWAQTPQKITLSLYHRMSVDPGETVYPVLIEGNSTQVRNAVQAAGGEWFYASGNISSARIPNDQVQNLASQPFVNFIDDAYGKMFALGDVMRIRNNVDSAHAGFAPLPGGFEGEGVVVGVIDLGIDINHVDFKDSLGNTRIKYVWDQTLTEDGSEPMPFDYGQECDSVTIESGLCNHIDPSFYYSHGTGVAGIAAGNGGGSGQHKGVAPKADIIAVNLSFDENFLGNVSDAIRYIFDKATEMGKPCVINTSVGTYIGSHDAKDLTAQLIESMLDEQDSRVIVAAAGNAGNIPFHLGYDLGPDTTWTWFEYDAVNENVNFFFWADTADFHDAYFSIGANDAVTSNDLGATPFMNLLSDFALSGSVIDSTTHSIMDGATPIGTVKTFAQIIGESFHVEVRVEPDSADYLWRFESTGDGRFDLWSDPWYTGHSRMLTADEIPTVSELPSVVKYMAPDSSQSIVSSWQCSDHVITVGSYWNRDTMTNYYGANPPISGTVGERITSSSSGPTRDGRIKPEISASGQWTMATGSNALTSWLIGLGFATYISEDGEHYLQGGTSFSSPIVAGAAALYLEVHPGSDYIGIKDALLQAAKSDGFTGTELPNNLWGYGKLDVFGTMKIPFQECPTPSGVNVAGITDSSVFIRWDDVSEAAGYEICGRLPGKPWRYMDPVSYPSAKIYHLWPSTTYDYRVRALCGVVDTSAWTSTASFTTPAARRKIEGFRFALSPNPAQDEFTYLEYVIPTEFEQAGFELWNIPGVRVKQIPIFEPQGAQRIDLEDVQEGIYLYRFVVDGHTVKTGKLIIK
jgi:subtilisin family serine protease